MPQSTNELENDFFPNKTVQSLGKSLKAEIPTLRCSLLSLFIEAQKKQGTGQIDPHLHRTFRVHGQRLVLLSEHDMEILQM